jgi:hypothetical protein
MSDAENAAYFEAFGVIKGDYQALCLIGDKLREVEARAGFNLPVFRVHKSKAWLIKIWWYPRVVSTAPIAIQHRRQNFPQLLRIAGDKLEAGMRSELTYRSFGSFSFGDPKNGQKMKRFWGVKMSKVTVTAWLRGSELAHQGCD